MTRSSPGSTRRTREAHQSQYDRRTRDSRPAHRPDHGPPGGAAATLLLVVALAVGAPVPVAGQDADFLLGRPVATLSLMGGWAVPGEEGGVFRYTRDRMTVDDGDFQSPVVMFEASLRATEWLDVGVGLEHTSREVQSEYRELVTQDDAAIRQSTLFRRTRLLASVKTYLLPRGRSISRFAWIPRAWSPYVGGGGGVSFFELTQSGDLVNETTLDIYELEVRDTGHAWTAHALAGLQLSLTPRLLLRGEYRYIWGEAPLDQTVFQGFGPLDLSGGRILVGASVRL